MQLGVLVRLQVALAEFIGTDFRLGRNQTLHQLHGRHLQREYGDGHIVLDCDVSRHRQDKRRLTHTGTGSENDHVGLLETARDAIEVHKSR